ncbi:MAG: phosphonate ABC transporter, permease protein PhnE [Myxococcota bacterium]|nr:phosphonate ABC transporter, permease protein PhnE [Myxococcota bacterium]
MTEAQPLVRGENLQFMYPATQRAALESVHISLYPLDRLALVGRSGSGKTTLLRLLEGSFTPTQGNLESRGRAVLIYQDHRLVPQRTVLENVVAGAFHELPPWSSAHFFIPQKLRKRAESILLDLGLKDLSQQPVGALSGGQKQRVAIARALCARPDILLADEPLASLDPENANRVLELLKTLQEKYGFALVLTTHHHDSIQAYFSQTLIMEEGKIRPKETPNPANTSMEGHGPSCHTPPKESDRVLTTNPKRTGALKITLGLMLFFAALAAVHSLKLVDSINNQSPAEALRFLGQFWNNKAGSDIPWGDLTVSLVETAEMAFLGTAAGALLALPLGIFATPSIGPTWGRHPIRVLLNAIRTIPAIFWALIFVAMIGLGPASGVFALIAYSIGYLAKFFYEGLEDTDPRPAHALQRLGASKLQAFIFATWPAARPSLLGSLFFMFEYNVRSASILGIVGAGGIGQDLMYYIEWRQFPSAGAGLLLILGVVLTLDYLSQYIRSVLSEKRGT